MSSSDSEDHTLPRVSVRCKKPSVVGPARERMKLKREQALVHGMMGCTIIIGCLAIAALYRYIDPLQ